MKVKNLGNNIILLIAKDQYELCSTFVRIQEFYESPYPDIRGHEFTLEEFMDVYAAHHGNFTYFTDWRGFNVPGNIVNKFANTITKFSTKEIMLYDLIRSKCDTSNDDFYVIGCLKGDQSAIKHEIAHALYYLNEDYNKEISVHAKKYKSAHPKEVKKLLKMGYDKDFIIDELQAYNTEKMKPYKNILKKYMKKCKVKI